MKKIMMIIIIGVLMTANTGFAQTNYGFLPAVYSLLLSDSPEQIPDINPRPDNYRPLKQKRFVPFGRQMEYIQIGPGYREDLANNFFVIDPLEYNYDPDNPGEPLVIPPGTNDLLDAQQESYFADTYHKTAASGMMDDDIQDEIAVVTWADTGPGTLTIINPTGEPDSTSFSIQQINVYLEINGDLIRPYDYDIALGDVDGDSYDELVIAGSCNKLGAMWIIDDSKAGNVLISKIFINGVFDGYSLGLDQLKVAVGNVDSDPAEEIAVAYAALSLRPSWTVSYPIHFEVYDDSGGNFTKLHAGTSQKQVPRATADEYAGGDSSDCYSGSSSIQELWNYYNIAMGDMDRDGRAEIALGIRSYDKGGWSTYDIDDVLISSEHSHFEYITVEVIDDAIGKDGNEQATADAYAPLNEANRTRVYYTEWNITDGCVKEDYAYVDYFKFFDMVDIDNDKACEIFTGTDLLDDIASEVPLGFLSNGNGEDVKLKPWIISDDLVLQKKVHNISYGDVNGDFRKDIIILYDDSIIQTIGFKDVIENDPSTGEPTLVSIEWQGGRTTEGYYDSTLENFIDQRGTSIPVKQNTILVPANVDNDSIMLEYTGDDPTAPPTMVDVAHTTYYGRNRIIAVMAVPPTIDGLNTPGSCTRFGQITGNSSNIGAEAKLRRGALVGIQAEVQSGFIVSSTVLTLEAELSAEIEVSSSIGTGLSMTKTITYYACNKEDRVVFSTTPYDRYIYTVASHPDPDLVGKEFTVDIPQPAEVLSWSKTYYNEHNGDQLDIGPEILQHTPGDISTYPTRTQKDYILSQALPAPLIDDGLWWLQFKSIDLYESDPVINVSQGSSTYIEEDSELRNTIFGSSGITSNVDFMAKACAFSVCGGLTSGFSVGAYAENTMTEGVTFRSTVWGLPAGAYETYKYKYGLFSYMQTLNDDETNITHEFIVLNYWVE